MTLTPGTHVGPYEIVSSLGAGGMGEVYRARDARLNRDVALKIVPDAFAADADRLARFQREAQVLASLSHPNIAAIYGLEDSSAGKALVLELVEGDTLADRIARGPMPLDEALPLAVQIAEALESAHEQGVIHRDLKPANIKVRDDGTVKVLDFGLAKMLESDATRSASSLSLSPTITTPAMTQIGMILGTAAYMAPEQARGKPADRRSDVWAFGCVLFEMLTGQQAFAGEDVTDTIAAVVRGEPAWQALPADTPASIRLLLQRCLEKDRRKRIGDISGVLFVLRERSLGVVPSPSVATVRPAASPTRSWKTVAAAAVALLLVGAAAGGIAWTLKPSPSPGTSRTMIVTDQPLARAVPGNHVAVSPDGLTVVYIATVNTVAAMYARRLDSFEAIPLAQPALFPFFRPDGQEVGFLNASTIRRVGITGGPPVDVVQIEGQFRGASWGPNGSIVFSTGLTETGLLRVNTTSGGPPETLTTPAAGTDHTLPRFLPDGNLLFTIISSGASNSGSSQVAVLDLRSSPPRTKVLLTGSDAYYLSSGHLLYLAGDSFRVVGFDLSSLELTDESPAPVLSGMAVLPSGVFADFAVSPNGTAAYLSAAPELSAARTLVLLDRNGRNEQALAAPPRSYLYPRVSPDQTRVAVDVRQGENDIWVWHLLQRTFTKITQHREQDRTPVWAGDDHLFYSSSMDGTPNIFRIRADGVGEPQRAARSTQPLFALSMAGNRLIVANTTGGIGSASLFSLDVAAVASPAAPASTPDPSSKAPPLPTPELLLRGPAGVINGMVSPDGRWLVYQSNETGSNEVYVQPYGAGATGLRQTISTMGGMQPRWSADGRQLFYVSGANEMMVVNVTPGPVWSASQPQRLFDASAYYFGTAGNPFWMYDVMRDGGFLMVKPPPAAAAAAPPSDHIHVIQHWGEELKKRSGR